MIRIFQLEFLKKLNTVLKKYLSLICYLSLIISCGSSDSPDVIKTKSGLYGSKTGKFLIQFPGKPMAGVVKNVLAGKELNLYSLSYNLGIEHRYRVGYVDYPEEVLAGWNIEELFDQIVKSGLSAESFLEVRNRQVENSKFEKSIVYNIRSTQIPEANGIMRIIQHEGRTFIISFFASRNVPNSDDFDAFIQSFKSYKSKAI